MPDLGDVSAAIRREADQRGVVVGMIAGSVNIVDGKAQYTLALGVKRAGRLATERGTVADFLAWAAEFARDGARYWWRREPLVIEAHEFATDGWETRGSFRMIWDDEPGDLMGTLDKPVIEIPKS